MIDKQALGNNHCLSCDPEWKSPSVCLHSPPGSPKVSSPSSDDELVLLASGVELDSTRQPTDSSTTVRQWHIAMNEAHWMTTGMLCIFAAEKKDQEEDLPNHMEHPLIKYNPGYWLLWCYFTVSIWLGILVHTPFGQADKCRPDELELESEVRVQWIYASDGMYVLMMMLDLVDFFSKWHKHGLTWSTSDQCGADCYMVAAAMYGALWGGNVYFLRCMQQRAQVPLRSCILANLGFAASLLVLLGVSAITGTGDRATTAVMAWGLRVVSVGCYVMVGVYYLKLWNIYQDSEHDPEGAKAQTWREILLPTCTVIAPSIVTFMIFVVGFAVHPNTVWYAIAG